METASTVVGVSRASTADSPLISKQQPVPSTPDLNNAVEGLPSYQDNSVKSGSRISPVLRTRTPVPYDSGNLENNETATASIKRSHVARARKPSMTDTVLASAATVVAAARRLVLHDDDEILEDQPNIQTITMTDRETSRNSILPSFLAPAADVHLGLEFSQRRMSTERNKTSFGTGANSGSRSDPVSSSVEGAVVGADAGAGAESGAEARAGVTTGVGTGARAEVGSGPHTKLVLEDGDDIGANHQDRDNSQPRYTSALASASGADMNAIAASAVLRQVGVVPTFIKHNCLRSTTVNSWCWRS